VIALKQAHPSVPLYVILNPDSGPGSSADSAYSTVISQLQSVGAIVIGYVYTSYGSRSTSTVEADVYSWKHFYPSINGIFFDEMSNSTNEVSYYSTLTSYVHSSGMTVSVGNPGAETPEAFFQNDAADNIVISETSGWPSTGLIENGGVGPQSMKSIIVYDASLNLDDLATATQYNSLVWVTSATLPNPYDSLPSYVSQLFTALDTSN
jgi:hypothetical protein